MFQEVEATTGFEPVNRGFASLPVASANGCRRSIYARIGRLFRVRDRLCVPLLRPALLPDAPAEHLIERNNHVRMGL